VGLKNKKNETEYILMHRDTDVCLFRISIPDWNVNFVEVYDDTFFPVNSKNTKENIAVNFNGWLGRRCIPDSREGIKWIQEKYKVSSLKELMLAGDGLSLSDHYWVKKPQQKKEWNRINYFDNPYSEELGRALFNYKYVLGDYNKDSPDAVLNGALRKRWKYNQKAKNSFLLKSGSGIFLQEPFNEYFVSLLLKNMNISAHVPYTCIKDGKEYVSSCPCICDKDVEMVTARDIVLKFGINDTYGEYVKLGQKKGLAEFKDDVDLMIAIDFVIQNEDRHWSNFGILRDGQTGSWIKTIPLFDNGGSLWNNRLVNNDESHCSSFAATNEECLRYIDLRNYVTKDNLKDMELIFDMAFEKYPKKERKAELRGGIIERKKMLGKLLDGGGKKG